MLKKLSKENKQALIALINNHNEQADVPYDKITFSKSTAGKAGGNCKKWDWVTDKDGNDVLTCVEREV